MRVLIVTSEFYPRIGGIERYVDDMAHALARDAEVVLVTGPQQWALGDRPFRSVAALNLAYPDSRDAFLQTQREVVRLARVHCADVIHLANAGLAVYAPALSSIAPVFATVHCKDFTRPWQLAPGANVTSAIRAGLAHCQRVFCVSLYTAAQVRTAVPAAAIDVLTPALSWKLLNMMEDFSLSKRLPGCFHVVTVGKLVRRKGHQELLNILEHVSRPVHWTIVGDGPGASEIRAKISNSPLANRIRMAGALDDRQMWQLVAESDLFALTPVEVQDAQGVDAEGFGLVFIEAAALGAPTVGSTHGGCRDAIPSACGIVVDPLDTSAAARAIDGLLDVQRDHATAEAAAARRREFVRQTFSWNDRAHVLLSAYRGAIGHEA